MTLAVISLFITFSELGPHVHCSLAGEVQHVKYHRYCCTAMGLVERHCTATVMSQPLESLD